MYKTYKFAQYKADPIPNPQSSASQIIKLAGGNGNSPYYLTEQNLAKVYEHVKINSINDNLDEEQRKLVKSTYGEIVHSSVEKLINALNIKPTDKFYDLGSGNGKVVM